MNGGANPEWASLAGPSLSQHLAAWRPIRPIDTRAPGLIYLAREKDSPRQVAMKLYRADEVDDEDDEDNKAASSYARTLIRGAMALHGFQHPNLVRVYAVEAPAAGVAVVMEYLRGGSLDRLFSAFGALPPTDLIPIALGIARGLDYVHKAGTMHCDVRPGRILLDGAGGCRLAGFSLSRSTGSTRFRGPASLPRSLVFAAPEQLRGQATAASDQFSLAAVMYRGLTGVRPFKATDLVGLIRQILTTTPAPASSLFPSLPAAVDRVLRRAMAPNPADRFPTCFEFATAMATALTGRSHFWNELELVPQLSAWMKRLAASWRMHFSMPGPHSWGPLPRPSGRSPNSVP